jgi:superfamily II DNA or RNA helicase
MSVRDIAVFEPDEEIVSPGYPLYPHQRQVLQDILATLFSPEGRVVAHLPTGAGKTRIASHVACYLLNRKDTDDALVIWLASTGELCEQAADELSRAWGHLGWRDVRIHRHWGEYTLDLRRLKSGFLVASLAKLWSSASRDNTLLAHIASQAATVIFDEAHQAVAETYSFMTEQLCSVRPPLLGLTATPGRTAGFSDEDYRLAAMFNRNKASIDPKGYDNPVTYLIQNRYLAEPRFVPFSFDSEPDIVDAEMGQDYSSDVLDALGDNSQRNLKIIELAQRAASRHPRTIVFCPSVESAIKCGNVLRSREIQSHIVTAGTEQEERHEIIETFKSDSREHMVMLNYGVLTAGFDAPRTRCVIIARPTKSLVLFSQMAGRAMRGPRAGGNRRAEIVTVVDANLPGFGSVTDAFTNWEELWSNRARH